MNGTKFIDLLRKGAGPSDSHPLTVSQLGKKLGLTQGRISQISGMNAVSEKVVSGIILRLLEPKSIPGDFLMNELKKKFRATNYNDLANSIGVDYHDVNNWKSQQIGATTIAKMIKKAKSTHVQSAIVPIAEFFPIKPHRPKKTWKIQPLWNNENAKTIMAQLKSSYGVYLFYNSQGKVLYIGKAEDQTIWNEAEKAYTRNRDTQRIKKPTSSRKREGNFVFKTSKVKLYEMAAFISAYSVEKPLIKNLEANIIRMFANDTLNVRVEKPKKRK